MSHGPIEDDIPQGGLDRRLVARAFAYLRPHARLAAVSFAFILVLLAAELALPLIIRGALDGPIAARDREGLAGWIGLFALAMFLQGGARAAEQYTTNLLGQRIVLDLRDSLFRHLQELTLSFFDRNPVGRLVTRVTHDVEALKELFTSGFISAGYEILLMIGIAIMMFAVEPSLALVSLSAVPVLVVVSLLFRKAAREGYRAMRKTLARVNAFLQENISGMRVVQLYRRQERNRVAFDGVNEDYLTATLRTIRAYALFFPAVEITGTIATAAILWYAGGRILEETLSFGTFLAFWYYAQKFLHPLEHLSERYNILQSAMAAAERLFALMDTRPEIPAQGGEAPPGRPRGEVTFEDVDFAYVPGTPVLSRVSFRIAPGERVAVVGATGAGKTTLVNLLLRFYDVTGGRVTIDGRDVRALDPRWIRAQVGLVLQDVFLFSGSVAENVAMGSAHIDRERIVAACRDVHLERAVSRMEQGYDTPLGERGGRLSVGERQLLSFARALAADPAMLILDEATSSVDSETEALIQDALERLMAGRTSLVIAHRLSTIVGADRILVLHKGELRECGKHIDLLAARGLYWRLYQTQFGRAERTEGAPSPGVPAPAGGEARSPGP